MLKSITNTTGSLARFYPNHIHPQLIMRAEFKPKGTRYRLFRWTDMKVVVDWIILNDGTRFDLTSSTN